MAAQRTHKGELMCLLFMIRLAVCTKRCQLVAYAQGVKCLGQAHLFVTGDATAVVGRAHVSVLTSVIIKGARDVQHSLPRDWRGPQTCPDCRSMQSHSLWPCSVRGLTDDAKCVEGRTIWPWGRSGVCHEL
jgi:hypothetical protein